MFAVAHYAPKLSEAERLGEEISALCNYLHIAKAHLLDLIREFDERRCWEELGFPSCVAWLGFQCGIGANAAREHLRVAYALVKLPKIARKFAQGRLSYSKVRAMTRVAHAENEDFLLMVAKHGTTSHIERLVSQYRRVEKLNRPDAAQEIFDKREVTYYYDDDGCLVMKAKMPADQGEVVVKALEMATEEHFVGAAIGRDSHLENGPCVSAETCAAKWYAGEEMDMEYAVWLMCLADDRYLVKNP